MIKIWAYQPFDRDEDPEVIATCSRCGDIDIFNSKEVDINELSQISERHETEVHGD